MPRLTLLLLLLASALAAPSAQACGPDTDCRIGERTYRISKPEDATGAFIFMHGWRGTADGIMRNTALRKLVADQGFALVAPQSVGIDWSIPNAPRGQRFDELPFFDALLDDLVENLGIARDRIVAGGFSAGGMMTWNLACYRSAEFAGFVAISGTYWSGPPEACPGPAPNMVHIHGMSDRTVPFAGRALADTRQGNVAESFDQMRSKATYELAQPVSEGRLTCESEREGAGHVLMLCKHGGGHDMPAEFAAFGLRKLRELTPLE